MKPSDLMLDIGRPVSYYPKLSKKLGGATATLLFCQLFYWQDKADENLGVYKTSEDLETETGLTYREQVTARKALKEAGVLIETNKRLEHRIYYKIDLDAFNELMSGAPVDSSGGEFPNDVSAIREQQMRSSGSDVSAVREDTKTQFDPTENTTEITTEIKRPCQEAELPDDAEPEPECVSPEQSVLNHLNAVTSSSFRDGKSTTGRIKARLAEGYSVDDLILVTDYLTAKWLNDAKMCDYLRPKTLFGPENCAEYFTMAKKWRDSGRPACVNGKWCINQASAGQLPHWNSAEGWEGFL